MSSQPHGFLDSNIVIHAFARDAHSETCRQLLTAIREGTITAILDPLVVHEITYGLPKFAKQMSRSDIVEYLESLLSSRGIVAEKLVLSKALQLWHVNPGIGFVDCFLATKAVESKLSVFTVNVRHLRRLGADVPDPLPAG